MPAPVCKSQDYQMTTLDGMQANTDYLGDASKANWVTSGTPKIFQDQVLLTLSETGQSGSGTLLASTSYVWYGKVSAQLKTSRGQGVVTAFILLSDVKDEIDFEFVGTNLNTAQSNYYFQGITDCECPMNSFEHLILIIVDHNEIDVKVGNSTFENYHTYELDWTPDQITWSVDGTSYRTLKKSDTWNSTTNQFHYPQTPARVQLSLWPAGSSKNGQGTIAWSGGLVDWKSDDVKANGYYYAMFKDVNVQCYSAPSGANISGKNSYIYTSPSGDNSSVATTDKNTILKSLLGSGTDPNKDFPAKPSASGTSTASASPSASSNVALVPGLTGAGPAINNHGGGSDTSGSSGSSGSGSGSGSGSSGSGTSTVAGSTSTAGIGGFVQGDQTKKSDSAPPKTERVFQGSMFAALVALMGMMIL